MQLFGLKLSCSSLQSFSMFSRPLTAAAFAVAADKVAEMEAVLAEKQVSGGLTPADLLATLLAQNRSAQSDFRPPRFLRTRRDGVAVRAEDAAAGGGNNHSWGTALDPWEIGWNAQRFTEERLSLDAVRRAFRCILAIWLGHNEGRTRPRGTQ